MGTALRCLLIPTILNPVKSLQKSLILQVAHSMFGLTGQEKISYILSAGWFLTESLFANKKMFSIAERYTSALTDLVLYKIDANAYDILIEKRCFAMPSSAV